MCKLPTWVSIGNFIDFQYQNYSPWIRQWFGTLLWLPPTLKHPVIVLESLLAKDVQKRCKKGSTIYLHSQADLKPLPAFKNTVTAFRSNHGWKKLKLGLKFESAAWPTRVIVNLLQRHKIHCLETGVSFVRDCSRCRAPDAQTQQNNLKEMF